MQRHKRALLFSNVPNHDRGYSLLYVMDITKNTNNPRNDSFFRRKFPGDALSENITVNASIWPNA